MQTSSHPPGLVASHAITDVLTISVRALAPWLTLNRYQVPEHQRSWNVVSISVSTLALILDGCQKKLELDRAHQGEEVDPLSAHTLSESWPSSSRERLTEEDEDRFRQREQEALGEADEDDKDRKEGDE